MAFGHKKSCRCTHCLDEKPINWRSSGSRNSYDGGYGTVGGRNTYYDTNPDGSTNLFPDGIPSGHHSDSPHEHIVVNEDGGVEYWRDQNGNVDNNYRDYRG